MWLSDAFSEHLASKSPRLQHSVPVLIRTRCISTPWSKQIFLFTTETLSSVCHRVRFSAFCFSFLAVLWIDWGRLSYAWYHNLCCLYTLILLWIHFLNRALWGTYLSGGLFCAFWIILLMPNMLRTAKVTLFSIYPVVKLYLLT